MDGYTTSRMAFCPPSTTSSLTSVLRLRRNPHHPRREYHGFPLTSQTPRPAPQLARPAPAPAAHLHNGLLIVAARPCLSARPSLLAVTHRRSAAGIYTVPGVSAVGACKGGGVPHRRARWGRYRRGAGGVLVGARSSRGLQGCGVTACWRLAPCSAVGPARRPGRLEGAVSDREQWREEVELIASAPVYTRGMAS
jgi:hypothetical protein